MAKIVYIADVCKEIFAGGDVPKDALSYEKTAEYNVPIFSNGEKNCGLYGYTNNARVKEPSITVSARGTIGYTAIRTEPFVPVVRLITLTPKSEVIDLDYLFYATQNYKFEGSGTSIPQLTVPILKKYKFPLPEMSHQKTIAVKFEKLDQLISLRKQQLAKLDELVKARFVEMFGDLDSRPKQKIKDITKRVKVGFVGTCEKYYTSNSEIPMLRTTNITAHGIDLKDLKYVTKEFHEKNPKSQVHAGDLLIARHGANGQANAYYGREAQCLNAIIIEPDINITNSIFLEYLINSIDVKSQINKKLVGSTQHVLNTTTLANVEVSIPEMREQQTFSAFVERVNQQKQTVQQSLEKLELMKKTLMQEFFG